MTKVNTPRIDNRLLYRRQYFIGPKFIDRFNSWNRVRVNKNIFLTYHPDLEFASANKINSKLFLLGFFIDPDNPEYTNSEILQNILTQNTDFNNIIKATYNLAGRWALIYSDDNNCFIFNDPAGLRQIFFSENNNPIWCAAQPHTLADELSYELDDDPDIQKYINSKLYTLWERSWVGNGTQFKNIIHLLPNHYLNLNNGIVTRYWPDEKRIEIPLEEAAKKGKKILENIFRATIKRYDIAQAITAGLDTRLLLAISKKFREEIYYFVQKFNYMDEESVDLKIPQELSSELGIDLHIIDASSYDLEFDKIYRKNVYSLQTEAKKYQHYNYFKTFQNKLIINGNISPIIKNNIPPQVEEINAENLLRLLERQNQKYAIKIVEKWLNKTLPISDKYDFNIIKLFYWEIHHANWGAMFNAELDIAVEEFSPLNCRNLINILLSTKDKHRDHSEIMIYKRIIELSWPETLQLPINPQKLSFFKKIKNIIIKIILAFGIKFLKSIGLYILVRRLYRKTLYK